MKNLVQPPKTFIIGHRDAMLTVAHKQAVQEIFRQLVKKYPNSPFVLFSQLAKGVDTMVAQWFLELKNKHGYDFRLIVSLPYDKAYYEKTQFETAKELATFRDILAQSERYFELNRLSDKTKQQLDKKPNANPEELNTYYRDSGEFVADSSNILIAIWDEIDNGATGGTAETVFYKKTGSYHTHITPHIFDKNGTLISIACNRQGQNKTLQLKNDYLSQVLKDSAIQKTLQKIEEINSSIKKIPKETIQQNAEWLFPTNKIIDKQAKLLQNWYAITDSQTIKSQKTYFFILKALFLLGFIIYVFFEIYKHLGLLTSIFFITISLITFAVGLYRLPLGKHSHRKYIENRVLAEALRVQFFWHIAGIKDSVANHIIRLHRKEYEWIRHITNGIYGVSFQEEQPEINQSLIHTHWIVNQKDFFESRVKKDEKKVSHFKIWEFVTFGLGIILLIVLFIIPKNEENHHLVEWLIVADSIVFGVFGLIKAYFEKRGYEQLINQYELMRDIYAFADDKLKEIDPEEHKEKFNKIIELAGKEALIENGNWYMIYKDKKPEMEGIG